MNIVRYQVPWEGWETENGITCNQAFDEGLDAADERNSQCPYGTNTPKLRQAWADGWWQYQDEN